MHPAGGIPRSGSQGVEVGVSSLTVNLCNSLAKVWLCASMTSGSVGLDVLVPKGGTLLPGGRTVNGPVKLELRLDYLRLPVPMNQ